jgi:serine/threonine protein kinase
VQHMVSNPAKEIPMNYGPWLGFSAEGKDLLKRLLKRDRKERISAADALCHPWFQKQPWWSIRKIVDAPQSNDVVFHHEHGSHFYQ